mmetsp:Transcript_46600/g.116082  ORF Transcript_46600/g.116082 Transcript_46600/m.116082 type:complete len:147 (+) Transcript_46600:332-772(+)
MCCALLEGNAHIALLKPTWMGPTRCVAVAVVGCVGRSFDGLHCTHAHAQTHIPSCHGPTHTHIHPYIDTYPSGMHTYVRCVVCTGLTSPMLAGLLGGRDIMCTGDAAARVAAVWVGGSMSIDRIARWVSESVAAFFYFRIRPWLTG